MPDASRNIILITGGNGFIGSHVARRLYTCRDNWIRVVDIVRVPRLQESICHEIIYGDLCDLNICEIAVRGVHTILHFAANVGGMGTNHGDNNFILHNQNHTMTVNLLQSCLNAGVKRFFFASSACVIPADLLTTESGIKRPESNILTSSPKCQGLNGLEKLFTEDLLSQFASRMDVRIARLHNVFGPGCAWNNGREQAPASMLRKALALKNLSTQNDAFEIWGDGKQCQSFLYIDDAVDGILKLLDSPHATPLKIDSEATVSVQKLAEIALRQVGIDPLTITFSYETSRPVGVPLLNSNCEQAYSLLGWKPMTSLEEGLHRTRLWIEEEMTKAISSNNQVEILREMLQSKVLEITPEKVVFAIFLPVTSRGTDLAHLRRFAISLVRTTWRDTKPTADIQYQFVAYLAINEDDNQLWQDNGYCNRAEEVLCGEGIYNIVTLFYNHPRGHIYKIWKDCARRAFHDGCDYMVLMGSDVELKDEGWMRDAHGEFAALATSSGTPLGFGCVAFTDTSSPGMPTFPIIHRVHMEFFSGEVIPDIFVNQDGDLFLFQLYRRWNCSRMLPSRISNCIEGPAEARYTKIHMQDWTFTTLDNAISVAEQWLKGKGCSVTKQVMLDVVIPCYRVDLSILHTILNLKSSPGCSVMFIVIVDDPSSPFIFELETLYAYRPDVRIRVNKTNIGASESRNIGLDKSSAEWVHFLDDDVVPEPDLLIRAEDIIRMHPTAAGFVGNVGFPTADSVFTTAINLSRVTSFWDIATRIEHDLPWGVTANLITRRNIQDGVRFDLRYPKTGGGEDIDFCRKKREASLARKHEGFFAAPLVKVTHPWWNGGRRSYRRFHNWARGDGALIGQFPEDTFIDFAPNSAELLFLCGLSGAMGTVFAQWRILLVSIKAFFLVVLASVLYDCFGHLYRHPEQSLGLNSSISGPLWIVAIVESTFIRIASEMGRLRGTLSRRQYTHIGRRFDWFTGRLGRDPIKVERVFNVQQAILFLFLFFICP